LLLEGESSLRHGLSDSDSWELGMEKLNLMLLEGEFSLRDGLSASEFLKLCMEKLNPLLSEGESTLPVVVSHSDYLEFLEKERSGLLATQNKAQKKRILLRLAQDLKVLPPANPSICGPELDISKWRYILDELIMELRTVVRTCSLEVRNSGVYVLTSTPYSLFLKLLANLISDANMLLLEESFELPAVVSSNDYLEFLEMEKSNLLKAQNKVQKKRILLRLARDLQVLYPPNPSILGPDFQFEIDQWRYILGALIAEMRTVKSSLAIHDSGVWVLTCTPYNLMLEMVAEHICSESSLSIGAKRKGRIKTYWHH
jgi:hypothetical protein